MFLYLFSQPAFLSGSALCLLVQFGKSFWRGKVLGSLELILDITGEIHMCEQWLWRPEEVTEYLRTKLQDIGSHQYGCWELNPGPLEE